MCAKVNSTDQRALVSVACFAFGARGAVSQRTVLSLLKCPQNTVETLGTDFLTYRGALVYKQHGAKVNWTSQRALASVACFPFGV